MKMFIDSQLKPLFSLSCVFNVLGFSFPRSVGAVCEIVPSSDEIENGIPFKHYTLDVTHVAAACHGLLSGTHSKVCFPMKASPTLFPFTTITTNSSHRQPIRKFCQKVLSSTSRQWGLDPSAC